MSDLLDIYIENESNLNDPISLSVQFWLYLLSNIISIISCSILLFYLWSKRILRIAIHNHIIILLLLICFLYELIDIPFLLYNYRYEISWETESFLYRFWSFIDIGLYATQLILFAWSVIERHIIVFHTSCLSTARRRFYIHYLPSIVLIIYCLVWYSVTILFPSCSKMDIESKLNDDDVNSCIFHDPIAKYFDSFFHQMLPLSVITIFSIALFLRIHWQKVQLNESINREKQHQLIFQILSISILYFVFYLPWIFVLICIQFHSLKDIGLITMPYAYFFSYYFIFLLPFVCWTSLPEFQWKELFR